MTGIFCPSHLLPAAGRCKGPRYWKLVLALKAKVTFHPYILIAWCWGGKAGNINRFSSLSLDACLCGCGEEALAAINQGPPLAATFIMVLYGTDMGQDLVGPAWLMLSPPLGIEASHKS